MFCDKCGVSLRDTARFCSGCGVAVASPQPAQGSPPVYSPPPTYGNPSYFSPSATPASVPYYSPNGGSPRASASSALLDARGWPQAPFERLASALFKALDQGFEPRGTGGLEVSKMKAFRTVAGLAIPQYYGEYVLPTFCRVFGVETVAGQPETAPIVTWNGWHTFLRHRILAQPDEVFSQLSRALGALNISLRLDRADLPAVPCPIERGKALKFWQEITALAQRARGIGPFGAGLGGGALGGTGLAAGNSSESVSSAMVQGLGKLVFKGAMNTLNGGIGGGGGANLFSPGLGMGGAGVNMFNGGMGGGVGFDAWSNAGNAGFFFS